MGSMFGVSCKWEGGSTSGIITDESEALGLDNLESGVVGWTCGNTENTDRSGLS